MSLTVKEVRQGETQGEVDSPSYQAGLRGTGAKMVGTKGTETRASVIHPPVGMTHDIGSPGGACAFAAGRVFSLGNKVQTKRLVRSSIKQQKSSCVVLILSMQKIFNVL